MLKDIAPTREKTLSLEGARLEMVERELARREMGLEEIEEFRRALAVYGYLTRSGEVK